MYARRVFKGLSLCLSPTFYSVPPTSSLAGGSTLSQVHSQEPYVLLLPYYCWLQPLRFCSSQRMRRHLITQIKLSSLHNIVVGCRLAFFFVVSPGNVFSTQAHSITSFVPHIVSLHLFLMHL